MEFLWVSRWAGSSVGWSSAWLSWSPCWLWWLVSSSGSLPRGSLGWNPQVSPSQGSREAEDVLSSDSGLLPLSTCSYHYPKVNRGQSFLWVTQSEFPIMNAIKEWVGINAIKEWVGIYCPGKSFISPSAGWTFFRSTELRSFAFSEYKKRITLKEIFLIPMWEWPNCMECYCNPKIPQCFLLIHW